MIPKPNSIFGRFLKLVDYGHAGVLVQFMENHMGMSKALAEDAISEDHKPGAGRYIPEAVRVRLKDWVASLPDLTPDGPTISNGDLLVMLDRYVASIDPKTLVPESPVRVKGVTVREDDGRYRGLPRRPITTSLSIPTAMREQMRKWMVVADVPASQGDSFNRREPTRKGFPEDYYLNHYRHLVSSWGRIPPLNEALNFGDMTVKKVPFDPDQEILSPRRTAKELGAYTPAEVDKLVAPYIDEERYGVPMSEYIKNWPVSVKPPLVSDEEQDASTSDGLTAFFALSGLKDVVALEDTVYLHGALPMRMTPLKLVFVEPDGRHVPIAVNPKPAFQEPVETATAGEDPRIVRDAAGEVIGVRGPFSEAELDAIFKGVDELRAAQKEADATGNAAANIASAFGYPK